LCPDDAGAKTVIADYEIHSGGHRVSVRRAPSALVALLDYLRSLGCRDGDVIRLGNNSVAWRGAVYSAIQSDKPDE